MLGNERNRIVVEKRYLGYVLRPYILKLPAGGLGSHFIREIMDEARFERPADGRGNILNLTKRIAGLK